MENDFLTGAFQLMSCRFLHAFRAAHGAPTAERIEKVPGAPEARRKIAVGSGRVQDIQLKVRRGESLLPQFAAKHVHWIIATSCSL